MLSLAPQPGDVFAVCTDGVPEQVPYQRLAQVLDPRTRPERAVEAILADCRAAGGHDNATLAVLRVDAA